MLQIIAVAASLLGIPVAWILYRRSLRLAAAATVPGGIPAGGASARRPGIARFLQSGWGFDWVYDRVLVRPFAWIARINSRDIVDQIPHGVGALSMLLSRIFRWTQNGRVRWYAAGVAAGAVLIVAAMVLL
jgi:NADH-quinone oxidoreductase subunit L